MRRYLTTLAATAVMTPVLLILPVSADPGPEAVPVPVSEQELPLGSAHEQAQVVPGDPLPTGAVSLFADTDQPASIERHMDRRSVELGLTFGTSEDGTIAGLRYFRGAGDADAHAGRLWSAKEELLGSLHFPAESTPGWQYAAFMAPISVGAGDSLVASYYTNDGYVADPDYFAAHSPTNDPLYTIENGESRSAIFVYRGRSGSPSGSYGSTNYWIDPVMIPASNGSGAAPAPPPPPPAPAPPDTGVAPNTIPSPGQVGFRGDRGQLRVVNSAASAPAGTTWRGTYLQIDGSGVVLDWVYVQGGIDYYGTGTLTIRNSVIEARGGTWSVILGRNSAGTLDISDSTIVWPANLAAPGPSWGNGAVHGDSKMILVRNDISGTPDGVQQGLGNSRFEQNYIHDMRREGSYPNNTHNDGIQLYGGPGVQVRYNHIELNGYDGTHQNAALFLSDDGNGFSSPQIIGNYLSGGGFQLRLEDGVNGAVVVGNRFGPIAGGFGEFLVDDGASVARWEDNRSSTGALLLL